ncbi:hypothetical protein KMZ30_07275 [Phycicoccus sp. KQZ13P-1]|uniref:hypothetical protein n=1 Tax=Phycicoccus mangrovi TaxID=2840470 RepID=UPI001C003EA0|nr:hypothetical protein [Phycicoccus mangrovi]MBT9255372.1 hypothetical protein [Phycicoccus mangrovi]
MSDVTLKAVLMAEDRGASRGLRRFGDDIDGVGGRAKGSSKEIGKVGNEIGGVGAKAGMAGGLLAGAKGFAGGLGVAGLAVGGLVAGLEPLIGFLGDSVQAASDLNETVSKAKVIYGDAADQMMTWAEGASKAAGLSKQAALDTASSFADMFLQLGFASSKAVDMSTDVVQLAADLGSFNNLDTDDVLERIAGGFRGEYDALQKLIPNISAARVESEAMNLGLVKNTVSSRELARARERQSLAEKAYTKAVSEHGKSSDQARRAALTLSTAEDGVAKAAKGAKGDITAQAKAQAVLSILHKDGSRAAGDFARTSDGLANRQKILTAEMENAKTEIGDALLPVMNELAGWFLREGVPAIKEFTKWVKDHKTEIMQAAKAIGAVVKWLAESWIGQLDLIMRAIAWTKSAWQAFKHAVNVGIAAIVSAMSVLMRTWAGVLRGLSKVPGFGWARDAANKMDNAADQADRLARHLRTIPDRNVRVNVSFTQTGQVRLPGGGAVDMGQYRARAGGGPVLKGTSYLVGENGPEIWTAPGTGSIVPARQTAALMRSTNGGSTAGGGGDERPVLVQLMLDGRVLAESLVRHRRQTGVPLGI